MLVGDQHMRTPTLRYTQVITLAPAKLIQNPDVAPGFLVLSYNKRKELPKMKCPICSQELTSPVDGAYVCPSDHGVLMTSKHLIAKDKDLLPEDTPSASLPVKPQEMSCPHCSARMVPTDYNATKIIIDACLKCHYRWLDEGEFTKIVSHKPDIDPQDLLFLLDVQEKTKALHANQSAQGAGVPGYSGVVGGAVRGLSAGHTHRTFGFLTGVTVVRGVKTMRKSKLMRVVVPIFLIAIIVLGYLVYRQVRVIAP